MRIIVDGMGGDNAPQEVVKGVVAAAEHTPHKICIVGQEPLIREELEKYPYDPKQIEIVHAEEVITNEDSPVKAIKRKKTLPW